MITYNKQTGTMLISQVQNGQAIDFELEIMQLGNCLAVFTHNNGTERRLYAFFADESHVKHLYKERNKYHSKKDNCSIGLFDDHIKQIRLNIYYKEAAKLANILAKYGYEVTIYYQKEN